MLGCRLLISSATIRMTICPIMEASRILHPPVNLRNNPCSSRGRLHQVWSAPLLVTSWKLFSGTKVTISNVVATPEHAAGIIAVWQYYSKLEQVNVYSNIEASGHTDRGVKNQLLGSRQALFSASALMPWQRKHHAMQHVVTRCAGHIYNRHMLWCCICEHCRHDFMCPDIRSSMWQTWTTMQVVLLTWWVLHADNFLQHDCSSNRQCHGYPSLPTNQNSAITQMRLSQHMEHHTSKATPQRARHMCESHTSMQTLVCSIYNTVEICINATKPSRER